MNLKELQDAHRALEVEMTRALRGFETTTGLIVSSIDLKTAPYHALSGNLQPKFVTALVVLPHSRTR